MKKENTSVFNFTSKYIFMPPVWKI